MEDLITVIIPIYNLEKYLHEGISSVINQTYKNLEIILVDDGSTDNSLRIARYYERLDKRVKVITQKNMGICMAMKNGLSISSGKYIARHDGDDINELDRYEKQLKYLKENNCDMIGCYLKSFGNGDKGYQRCMEGLNIPIRNFDDQFMRIYLGKAINGGAIFGKSEVFKKLMPFHKDYGIVEDRLIYLLFHTKGYKIGIIEEVLYNYRVHSTNTSLNPKSRKNMLRRHFELMFNYLFYDVLFHYENIIFIEISDRLELIKSVINESFNNLNCKFVDENQFMDFMNEELFKYSYRDSVIFSGGLFLESVYYSSKRLGYKYLENLFLLV